MKKISAITLSFSFTGCFLGAGYVSGQELYQFFGSFGDNGVVGIVLAAALLGALCGLLSRLAYRTGISDIDTIVAGPDNKILIFIFGVGEFIMLFGTYVVMAAAAGALVKKMTGVVYSDIIGSLIFCFIMSTLAIRGINGLVKIYSAIVPVLVVCTVATAVITVASHGFSEIVFVKAEATNPLISNWLVGSLTFVAYNFFCAVGVITPLGVNIKELKTTVFGMFYGALMLLLVALSVLSTLAVLPFTTSEQLPMLAAAETISPYYMYFYAFLLMLAISGASLSCLVPTAAYLAEHFEVSRKHGAITTYLASFAAFGLSCFGFSELVGTVFPVFGYFSIIAICSMIVHYIRVRIRDKKSET